jgi:hypothetical protein
MSYTPNPRKRTTKRAKSRAKLESLPANAENVDQVVPELQKLGVHAGRSVVREDGLHIARGILLLLLLQRRKQPDVSHLGRWYVANVPRIKFRSPLGMTRGMLQELSDKRWAKLLRKYKRCTDILSAHSFTDSSFSSPARIRSTCSTTLPSAVSPSRRSAAAYDPEGSRSAFT